MRSINGGPDALVGDQGDVPRSEVTIDTARKMIVVQQWPSRLDIVPQTVAIPFETMKMLAAQAILVDAGMMQVGPPAGESPPLGLVRR